MSGTESSLLGLLPRVGVDKTMLVEVLPILSASQPFTKRLLKLLFTQPFFARKKASSNKASRKIDLISTFLIFFQVTLLMKQFTWINRQYIKETGLLSLLGII